MVGYNKLACEYEYMGDRFSILIYGYVCPSSIDI